METFEKRRRKHLPGVEVLEEYILAHPWEIFPKRKTVFELAFQTGNAYQSIRYYFANTRRRILRPLQSRTREPQSLFEQEYYLIYHDLFTLHPLENVF